MKEDDRPQTRRITTGSPFETEFAYSRAVARGDWCFVAGTTGYDYSTMTTPKEAAEQTRNALATIARTFGEAGFSMRDVVRIRYIVTDAALRYEIAPVLRAALGEVRPAAMMIIAGLNEPEMKVEIEATAFRG